MTVTLALWMGAVVLVITVTVVVQLLIVRLQTTASLRRQHEFERVWFPVLVGDEESRTTPMIGPRDVVLFIILWTRLHELVIGQSRERLNTVGYRVGIDRLARSMLGRRTLRERLLAVCALGQIRDKQSWSRLLDLAHGSHLALSLAAARALVQIDAKAAIPLLLPLIAARDDWSPSVVVRMLQEAGADNLSGPLVSAAMAASPEQAHRLVRYFGVAHSQAAVPAVRQLIRRTTDVECLVACLRVFSDAGDLETVRRYLTHPIWEVRVQAVIALGRMGTPADERSLVELLSDPEWWVRYRAAHALYELPPADPTRLERIATTLDDRFARDMLTHVQAERRAA